MPIIFICNRRSIKQITQKCSEQKKSGFFFDAAQRREGSLVGKKEKQKQGRKRGQTKIPLLSVASRSTLLRFRYTFRTIRLRSGAFRCIALHPPDHGRAFIRPLFRLLPWTPANRARVYPASRTCCGARAESRRGAAPLASATDDRRTRPFESVARETPKKSDATGASRARETPRNGVARKKRTRCWQRNGEERRRGNGKGRSGGVCQKL